MKFCRLYELCDDIIDCPHSTPNWLESGIPVIRNFNLGNGKINLKKQYYVDEQTYIERTKRAVPEGGDIIISREAPMGVVGLVPDNYKCCLGQRLVLLKTNKSKVNPNYLLYALESNFVKKQINRVDSTGSIVSNLNIPDLKNLIIPIVDNSENIANIIKDFDDYIDNLMEYNKKLESIMKDIYLFNIEQFGIVKNNIGAKTKYSEIIKREIPINWDEIKITDICEMISGFEPGADNYIENKKENTIPFIRVSDLDTNNPVYVSDKYKELSFVDEDEVIISFDGSVGRVKIGYCGIYSGGIKKAISINKCINNALIYQIFKSDYVQKIIFKYSQGSILKHASTSIPHIIIPFNKESFEKTSVLLEPYYNICVNNIRKINIMKEFRNTIVPLLMNNQIKIKEVE